MISIEILTILIFLFPGLLSVSIINLLVIRRKQEKDIYLIIEALLLSIVEYGIYSIFTKFPPISRIDLGDTIFFSINSPEFPILLIISFIIPIIISLCINSDIHMKIARLLKLTSKTSRMSVWNDAFQNSNKYVIIVFSNGRRVYGWPLFYSDEPNEQYIYLYRPYWIIKNKFIDAKVDGILITPEQKIEFIEFL
jgi:hypothetical protein